MANARDESTRTTTATMGTDGTAPQVQVYDTDKSGTLTTSSAYTTTPTTDTGMATSGTNWGTIILAILIVLAVLALVWWLFLR